MIYTIYMNKRARFENNIGPDGQGLESLTAIAEGQTRWAFILPPFWLAYHKLWFELAIYILLSFFLFALLATPLRFAAGYLAVLPGIYLLLEGNQLRRYKLERNGMVMAGVAEGKNKTEAIERFLSTWQPEVIKTPPPPVKSFPSARQSPIPTFGLFGQASNPGRG